MDRFREWLNRLNKPLCLGCDRPAGGDPTIIDHCWCETLYYARPARDRVPFAVQVIEAQSRFTVLDLVMLRLLGYRWPVS